MNPRNFTRALCALGLIVALPAKASIIYWDVADVSWTAGQQIFANVYTGEAGTTAPSSYTLTGWFNYNDTEQPMLNYGAYVGNGTTYGMAMLAFGDAISGANTFNTVGSAHFDSLGGGWAGGGNGFVGFRLGSVGSYNYGWAQFNYDDTGNTLTLLDMAYEDTVNTEILAGGGADSVSVPAPGALGLFALGALALRRNHRRKQIDC